MKHYSRILLAALVTALAGCDSEPAPAFEPEGTGGVEGFLFLDVNRDGAYDPSAGDTTLKNVRIRVRDRNTTSTLAGGETVTGTTGRFVLPSLPLGTHDLVIDTVGIGGAVSFCQNPIPLTIYRNETRFVNVTGRKGCVITILEAETKAQGTFMTIRGTVTTKPGTLRTNLVYVQDATGAIGAFGLTQANIDVGDVLEVSGTLANFGGELQLNNPQIVELVDNAGTVSVKTMTTAQVAAAGLDPKHPDQGRLVRVLKARITGAWGVPAPRNIQNAPIDDGSGPTDLRFENTVETRPTPWNTLYPVGKCYNITGILGSFNNLAQIKPRTLADVQEVPCTP